MRRSPFVVLATAATAAALGISGCAGGDRAKPPPPPAPVPSAVAAPPAAAGPPPAAEALAYVIYRLADTGVPAADKLASVHDTAPTDATALDAFGTALRDGGFAPITVTATDIRWSDTRPGHVLATITITTTDPDDPGEFAFPMEFRPSAGGWQLSRETADMLLAFGNDRTGPVVPGPAPPPVPGGQPLPPAPTPGS